MRDILDPENRSILTEFASSDVLVALDFDGTLAPIVDAPEDAKMRPLTSRLLDELALTYPCTVVSGRARADLLERLAGAHVHGAIGNHGVEPWETSSGLAAEVERWQPILRSRLVGFRGVTIEDKAFSVSVHYRHARRRENARERILEIAADLGNVRVIGGEYVVNILPAGSPHKGSAVLSERLRLGCSTAIYVGDDDIDEDVFSLDEQWLLTIRVGPSPESAARYSIASQSEIDDLLRALIEARRSISDARSGAPLRTTS